MPLRNHGCGNRATSQTGAAKIEPWVNDDESGIICAISTGKGIETIGDSVRTIFDPLQECLKNFAPRNLTLFRGVS
jgi:hypothetical protein